jgi:hypothetical protein
MEGKCKFSSMGLSCDSVVGQCFCLESVYYNELNDNISLPKLVNFLEQPFKRAGDDYKILCLFHRETHPSLHLFNNSKSFYCFGCGISGSLIDLAIAARGTTSRKVLYSLCSDDNTQEYVGINDDVLPHKEELHLFSLVSMKIRKAYKELPKEQAYRFERQAEEVLKTQNVHEILTFLCQKVEEGG